MFQSSLNNYIYIFQNKYTILYLSTFQKFYLYKTFLSIDKNHTHLSSLTFSSLKHPYKKIYRFALNENEFAIRKEKNKLHYFSVTPISSPGCEYQFGLYPASDACSTTYIRCAHGHPNEDHCDAGLVYDAKSHNCVWPDQLLPYCNPEEIVGFKCPHKVPSHSAAAKFWPYPR